MSKLLSLVVIALFILVLILLRVNYNNRMESERKLIEHEIFLDSLKALRNQTEMLREELETIKDNVK